MGMEAAAYRKERWYVQCAELPEFLSYCQTLPPGEAARLGRLRNDYKLNLENNNMGNTNNFHRWVIAGLVSLLAVILLVFALAAVGKTYSRYQKRADANNNVKVVNINIRKAQQQARVIGAQNATVKAKAHQRYLEAVGIRQAQDEISSTLTPLYIQHEAIQAQERTAQSGKNNTIIYTPSGNNGVPLVQTPPLTRTPQTGG